MLKGSWEDRKVRARAMAAELERRERLANRTPEEIAADEAEILDLLGQLVRAAR